MIDLISTLKLYWVFENEFVKREYYKDYRGGIHVKTEFKKILEKEKII